MPVYKLLDEMPYSEFEGWFSFLDTQPIGWRDDMRFSVILQALGMKAKPEEVFDSIRKLKEGQKKIEKGPLGRSFIKSQMYNRMLQASGGVTIPL
jgi:hypothetical protein